VKPWCRIGIGAFFVRANLGITCRRGESQSHNYHIAISNNGAFSSHASSSRTTLSSRRTSTRAPCPLCATSLALTQERGTPTPLVAFTKQSAQKRGAAMIGILILSLSILFAGALPWWPYSAAGRLRHHRPWDWLMDQNRLTSHLEIKGATGLEGDPATIQVEQLVASLERGRARGRELQEAYAIRHSAAAASNGRGLLVA